MNKSTGLTTIDIDFLNNFKCLLINKNNEEIINFHEQAKGIIEYKCKLLFNELEKVKNEAISNINGERSSH